MKFVLEIELGNDAMQTPRDVADALTKVSKYLRTVNDFGDDSFSARIRDINGNSVGEYEVKP